MSNMRFLLSLWVATLTLTIAAAKCVPSCRVQLCNQATHLHIAANDTPIAALCANGQSLYNLPYGSALVMGAPIVKYAPEGMRQTFSPSFFKLYTFPNGTSAVGHEVVQQNQVKFLNGLCVKLPVANGDCVSFVVSYDNAKKQSTSGNGNGVAPARAKRTTIPEPKAPSKTVHPKSPSTNGNGVPPQVPAIVTSAPAVIAAPKAPAKTAPPKIDFFPSSAAKGPSAPKPKPTSKVVPVWKSAEKKVPVKVTREKKTVPPTVIPIPAPEPATKKPAATPSPKAKTKKRAPKPTTKPVTKKPAPEPLPKPVTSNPAPKPKAKKPVSIPSTKPKAKKPVSKPTLKPKAKKPVPKPSTKPKANEITEKSPVKKDVDKPAPVQKRVPRFTTLPKKPPVAKTTPIGDVWSGEVTADRLLFSRPFLRGDKATYSTARVFKGPGTYRFFGNFPTMLLFANGTVESFTARKRDVIGVLKRKGERIIGGKVHILYEGEFKRKAYAKFTKFAALPAGGVGLRQIPTITGPIVLNQFKTYLPFSGFISTLRVAMRYSNGERSVQTSMAVDKAVISSEKRCRRGKNGIPLFVDEKNSFISTMNFINAKSDPFDSVITFTANDFSVADLPDKFNIVVYANTKIPNTTAAISATFEGLFFYYSPLQLVPLGTNCPSKSLLEIRFVKDKKNVGWNISFHTTGTIVR